jgi:hypothetical protein
MQPFGPLMALACYKTQNCTDQPMFVIINNNGSTGEVILDEAIRDVNDFYGYKNCKYNGLVCYTITISKTEYDRRFSRLVKRN